MTTYVSGREGASRDTKEIVVEIERFGSWEEMAEPLVDAIAKATEKGREIVSVSHSVDSAGPDPDKMFSYMLVTRKP